MTVAHGAREVPDSEDELLTSSPEALPDGTVNQLDGAADEPPQDGLPKAGDFLDCPEDGHAENVAKHDKSSRDDKQQVVSRDSQSLETVRRANSQSDALQQNVYELKTSHQHTSLADKCHSSNQHSSASTDPSRLQILNQQKHLAEPLLNNGEKELIATAEKKVSNFAAGTSNTSLPSGPSSCVDQHLLATDSKRSNEAVHRVSYSTEDAIESAHSGLLPTVSRIERRLTTTESIEEGQPGVLSLEETFHLQQNQKSSPVDQKRELKEPQHSLLAGGQSYNDHNNSFDTKDRGHPCPLSLAPEDVSSPRNEHVPTGYTSTDGVSLIRHAVHYDSCHSTKSTETSSSLKEKDFTQTTLSYMQHPNSPIGDINIERLNSDKLDGVSQPSYTPKQQQKAGRSREDNAACSQMDVNADTPSRLHLTTQSALRDNISLSGTAKDNEFVNVSGQPLAVIVPSLEPENVTLQEQNEAQEFSTSMPNDQDKESTEAKGNSGPFAMAGPTCAETTRKPEPKFDMHTPSSAVSITKETQLPPVKSAQEITLADLKEQRAALIVALTGLPVIRNLITDASTPYFTSQISDAEPTESEVLTAAQKINKRHIKLLHEYNEIKDVGQGLMGLIADQRGVRIVDVQDEFGIDAQD